MRNKKSRGGDIKKILLAHGDGGKLMHQLIKELFKKKFHNEILDELDDSAVIKSFLSKGSKLAFTTDSYVVNPIFFPGGDIGKLAICGTVNDLVVSGAKPLYISCAAIIEEGLEYDVLERITDSIAKVIKKENLKVVTGDVKVVEKNSADKIFINTSGIGLVEKGVNLSKNRIKIGDKIIINGSIGEHGLAILSSREEFDFQSKIKSDCVSLYSLVKEMLATSKSIKFMRDPTRGGLATTLNEIVDGMDFGVLIDEDRVPVKKEVKALCEILGFDPLYMANEGKVVAVVANKDADILLEAMRNHTLGKGSQIIGEVIKTPKQKVIAKTKIGSTRIIEMLTGSQLPRIC